ncbi:hypothetical protein N332_07779, partial [Mesitornis unicolor]
RKEVRRVRFQLDKAPPEAEGALHPRNGWALRPPAGAGGESALRALEERIREMREQLRVALLQRSELVATLGTAKG